MLFYVSQVKRLCCFQLPKHLLSPIFPFTCKYWWEHKERCLIKNLHFSPTNWNKTYLKKTSFKKSPHIYLNLFSVKKLRNSLLLQTVTDAWALSLSGVHAYPFTSHQSSFLFYIFDQPISVLKLVWLVFKLLLENYLDRKEWMRQWGEATFPVTMGLWFLNYYVDN